jgi:hypothetical protein
MFIGLSGVCSSRIDVLYVSFLDCCNTVFRSPDLSVGCWLYCYLFLFASIFADYGPCLFQFLRCVIHWGLFLSMCPGYVLYYISVAVAGFPWIPFCVYCCTVLSGLRLVGNWNFNYLDRFSENPQISNLKNPSSRSQVSWGQADRWTYIHTDRQTDRQT